MKAQRRPLLQPRRSTAEASKANPDLDSRLQLVITKLEVCNKRRQQYEGYVDCARSRHHTHDFSWWKTQVWLKHGILRTWRVITTITNWCQKHFSPTFSFNKLSIFQNDQFTRYPSTIRAESYFPLQNKPLPFSCAFSLENAWSHKKNKISNMSLSERPFVQLHQ